MTYIEQAGWGTFCMSTSILSFDRVYKVIIYLNFTFKNLNQLIWKLTNMGDSNPQGKPFTLEEPEFDEDTYYGRFETFRATANPIHAFYSNKRIQAMRDLISAQNQAEEE